MRNRKISELANMRLNDMQTIEKFAPGNRCVLLTTQIWEALIISSRCKYMLDA